MPDRASRHMIRNRINHKTARKTLQNTMEKRLLNPSGPTHMSPSDNTTIVIELYGPV